MSICVESFSHLRNTSMFLVFMAITAATPIRSLWAEADATVERWSSDGPTAAEIENLCLLNRFRADPRAEADRIITQSGAPRGIDWELFRQQTETLSPVPPAVWSQSLTAAARQHVRHLLATGGRGARRARRRRLFCIFIAYRSHESRRLWRATYERKLGRI